MAEKIYIDDIADALEKEYDLQEGKAKTIVQSIFDVITEALESEKYIKIKGLGTFKLIDVESRESVNINTGERIEIQGHKKISFTADVALKELINRPFSYFETVALNDGVQIEDLFAAEAIVDEQVTNISELQEPIQDTTNTNVIAETLSNDEEVREEHDKYETEKLSNVQTKDSLEKNMIEEPSVESVNKEYFVESDEQQQLFVSENVSEEDNEGIESLESIEDKRTEERNSITAKEEKKDFSSDIKIEKQKISIEPVANQQQKSGERREYKRWWPICCVAMSIVLCLCYYFYQSREDQVVMAEIHHPILVINDAVIADTILKIGTVLPADSIGIDENVVLQIEDKKDSLKTQEDIVQKLDAKAAYQIVGTLDIHSIQTGNTLRNISFKYYGTKELYNYIIEYNRDIIMDPDNVPVGTDLKIPKLKLK